VAEPADGDTGVCFVLLEPDGERTFVTSAGIDARLRPVDLASVEPAAGDWVYVSGYDLAYPVSGRPLAELVGGLAPGVRVMFDPGPLVADIDPDWLAKVLRRSDIVSLNAREAAALAGRPESDGVPEALDTLAALRPLVGPDTVLCLRRGAAGCIVSAGAAEWAESGEPVTIAAPEVRMVDSTGAGDCHTGVLVAGLAQGLPLVRAARRANIAAAVAVTRRGPATCPTPAEIDALEPPEDASGP
jgi:sugar/nucleoside kinase (ribokinase family)